MLKEIFNIILIVFIRANFFAFSSCLNLAKGKTQSVSKKTIKKIHVKYGKY